MMQHGITSDQEMIKILLESEFKNSGNLKVLKFTPNLKKKFAKTWSKIFQ